MVIGDDDPNGVMSHGHYPLDDGIDAQVNVSSVLAKSLLIPIAGKGRESLVNDPASA